MTRMDWEKAARQERVARSGSEHRNGERGITNKQAKRLAQLRRALNEPYNGSGMTAFQATKAIRYAEAMLGLRRGQPIPRDAKRKRQESGMPADTWWWTIAKFTSRCADCGEAMPKGTTVAYNHHLQRALCELCCGRAGHTPELSRTAREQQRDAA